MRYLINILTKLALLALTAMLPQLASAHDFKVGGIYYNINGNEATVTYRGSSYYAYSNEYTGAVNIPSSVTYNGTTYSVTTIGSYAFSGCTGLTSVTIPNSVTTIGNSAFNYCSGLTSMVVECGNTKYDSRNNCNAIIETATNALICGCKNTIIPGSVTTIGSYAFYRCSGLTSVTIPNSVTTIGEWAFRDCTGLTSVTIPNSVTTIGGYAFAWCTGLTSVTIPNSVTTIGGWAFYNCTGLTSVTIPNSVTTIGNSAFYECTGLTSLTLTGKGSWNPQNNMPDISQIRTLNIGSGITSLGNFGFTPDVVNCYAATPPSCSSGTFSNYDGALHVPQASMASYFMADYWQNFNNMVNDLTDKITLDITTANLIQWGTLSLAAVADPEGSNILWTSNNPAVATVDENGVVTATGVGECDIFATLASNPAVYASCHVIVNVNVTLALNLDNSIIGANQALTVYPTCSPDVPVELVVTTSDPSVAVARVINRTNAPAAGLMQFAEEGKALAMMEEIAAPSGSKAPALASEKAIMIVGVQNGTATITVTTADGKATPAVLELHVVDVNGDRVITSSDITQLYSYLLSSDETYAATSDVNGDGNITAADITVLYNLLLGN